MTTQTTGGASRLAVRPVASADLPRIEGWLQPGAERALPADGNGDDWLLAEAGRGAEAAPRACARLRRAIGLDLPRPWYHVGCVVHAAPALARVHRQHTLQLGNDLTGASELADLAWDRRRPLAEQAQALRTLVDAALARIRSERARWAATLIVELPGLRDAAGASPFWHGLGRHFYRGDVRAAAERFGPAWRSHVAALLPRQPVYASFLPAAAQAAMAQVDPSARVCLDVLWQAGFRYGHHITVDDGGPVFELRLDTAAGSAP